MKTQATAKNSTLSEAADFPAPGALTPAIMATLWEMVSSCQRIARQAEDKGDLKTALAAIKETHRLLMNLAKLDAARLKAQETPKAAKNTAAGAAVGESTVAAAPKPGGQTPQAQTPAGSPADPAREDNRRPLDQNTASTDAATPEPSQAQTVQAAPPRQELPPGARGITNLGNIVW